MLCSRCKKRTAVVFVSRQENGKTVNQGYCLQCAREIGIQPVDEMLNQMGISEGDVEQMETELQDFFEGKVDDADGHALSLPPFLQNMLKNPRMFALGPFGTPPAEEKPEEKPGEKPPQSSAAEGEKPQPHKRRQKPKLLEQFCINLTRRAKEGKLDRIVGRERETDRVLQILNRRQKNNPCLIGEPGVGKTAVAEGLAIRIAEGNVPARLTDKEIYLLDLTALVAGTQFRGQFESRIKNLIAEIRDQGNVILVIDEVHTLVSAGEAEGSMSAANILKPALSRGEIQVIGATTFNEYRKSIEKDAALERRFQPVTIEEPSMDDTVSILMGVKSYYEKYHGVTIDEETVRAAASLSERYITDRFLPDKAIDLIDEAASLCNIEDKEAAESLLLGRRIAELKEKEEKLQPEDEKFYETRADLVSERMRLEEQLTELEISRKAPAVTGDQLAKVVELWTGIPASKIAESEFDKLAGLGDELRARVIGQEEAIDALVRALRRNRAGVAAKRKPASFIFIGPTGVGKTELCKTLAGALFDTPDTMIRVDMSEYMEKHSVSRLIGSPPGYIGYDEAGQLTEKVRRKPYCVVLFDEIEKAHPDVLNVMLQILDDGRITDAHGRTVNFENTVIIMTSNAGSERREAPLGFGGTVETRSREKAMKALEGFLCPEFINRVDEIVAFRPLDKEDFASIAGILLGDLKKAMAENGRTLTVGEGVEAALVEHSFSDKYGARSLRRAVEREVEDALATLIVEERGRRTDHLRIDVAEDGSLKAGIDEQAETLPVTPTEA
ncbi:MAG: ATP-dependent Clp protease ATP-binding subunit [Clostridia bacterium]|nr:ATP-dependent Clp protease ATP-binding subunit [Clostridia bacterium]